MMPQSIIPPVILWEMPNFLLLVGKQDINQTDRYYHRTVKIQSFKVTGDKKSWKIGPDDT